MWHKIKSLAALRVIFTTKYSGQSKTHRLAVSWFSHEICCCKNELVAHCWTHTGNTWKTQYLHAPLDKIYFSLLCFPTDVSAPKQPDWCRAVQRDRAGPVKLRALHLAMHVLVVLGGCSCVYPVQVRLFVFVCACRAVCLCVSVYCTQKV